MKKPGNTNCTSGNINQQTQIDTEAKLVFTFTDFNLKAINIPGVFNNHYKDQEEYEVKISALFGQALPLLSGENTKMFFDPSKTGMLHLHSVRDRKSLIARILQEYNFPENRIQEMIAEEKLYQLEIPYLNGASRIIFEQIDNLISFLFIDPNHHIYLNRQKVEATNSLFYEFCPVYEKGKCERMDYFRTCFAFEYLDREKYLSSFENSYTI